MKYLKRFNESKETMTDKDRRAVAKKVKYLLNSYGCIIS